MSEPIRKSATETPEATITRLEWSTGAATLVRAKSPPPAVTMPLRTVCEMGSLEVGRREFDEDLVTEWDRVWGQR